MNLFLDIDEVLLDTIDTVVQILNKRYNKNINPKDIKEWSFKDQFPMLHKGELETLFESDEFFKLIQYKEDAHDFLLDAMSNNEITFVTKGSEINNFNKKSIISRSLGFPLKTYDAEGVFDNKFSHIYRLRFIGLDLDKSKSEVDMSHGIFIDDNEDNLYESNAIIKVLLENNKNADWNSTWNGLRVKTIGELKILLSLLKPFLP